MSLNRAPGAGLSTCSPDDVGCAVSDPEHGTLIVDGLERGEHRSEGPLGVVVAGLGYQVVVHTDQLKPGQTSLNCQISGVGWLAAAIVLDAEFQALGLRGHGEVDVLLDTVR